MEHCLGPVYLSYNGTLPIMTNHFWLPVSPASDKKAMQQFSRGFSILLSVVFSGLLPWLFSAPVPIWPLIVSGVLLLVGEIYSPAVYPVYRVWMVIASILSWVNTRLIMLIAFYLLIFPIGLALQLLGKLQYKKVKWPVSNEASSYWVKREHSPTKENLKEPF